MTTPHNNDIMARLLNESGTSIPENTPTRDDETTSIAAARVLSTRYKVYLLVMLVLLYVLVQYLFFPLLDRQQAQQAQLQNIVSQLQSFESKRLQYIADAAFIENIENQQEILLNCINNQTACEALDEGLRERVDLAKMFVQLDNIIDPVMGVDEKRILASLNDYALVRNPNNTTATRERNGAIQSIRIADPVMYDGAVYRVPIDVEISFSNKDGLMSFINNIENSLAANASYRLLYVIDQIDYDVVRYTQEQKTKIQLSLFYYNP
jgi:type II secretory pathway component PulM